MLPEAGVNVGASDSTLEPEWLARTCDHKACSHRKDIERISHEPVKLSDGGVWTVEMAQTMHVLSYNGSK